MTSIVKHHSKVYFTFGRFQPPTIGHKVLIDKLASLAEEETADAYVFVSSKQNDMEKYKRTKAYREMRLSGHFISTDLNENPLPVGTKVEILRKMYPSTGVTFIDTTVEGCPQLFNIVDALRSAGYEDITMGVGSDRVSTFEKVFKGSLKVESLGERTVNSANMSARAMSGTKMREAAISGNKEAFLSGVLIGDMTREDGLRLMNMIRLSLEYTALVEGGKTKKIRIKHRRRPKTYRLRDDEKFEI
jgi:hypothetical protein